MHFRNFVLFAACFLGGGIFVALSTGPSASSTGEILNGSPVNVKSGSTSICVGRQFIEPDDLSTAIKNKKPVADNIHRRVELNLFAPELNGYTAAHYKGGIATTYDRRKYPANWVRITIFPEDQDSYFKFTVKERIDHSYEPEARTDFGFTSHRRERQCVGKVFGSGNLQIEEEADCLDDELKYNNPLDRRVVLKCNLDRCWVMSRLQDQSIWYDYDFPRSFLSQWHTLHPRIQTRLAEWKQDKSCF